MAETSGESLGLAILTVAEVSQFFSTLLPDLPSIADYSGDESGTALYWVRRGEVNALCLSLLLGVGASMLAKNPLPFFGCAAMSAYLIYQYEHALKHGADHDIVDIREDT